VASPDHHCISRVNFFGNSLFYGRSGVLAITRCSEAPVAYYLYQDQTKTPPYGAKNIPFKKYTHLIHVAIVVNPSGDGSISISPHAIETTLIPKAHAAGVRVLVCVQGPASGFSEVASAATSRSLFAQNVKDFVLTYHYDGVDID
jgi:GH18 family chitinase